MITNSHHASGLPGTAAAQRKPACGASPPAAARQAGSVIRAWARAIPWPSRPATLRPCGLQHSIARLATR